MTHSALHVPVPLLLTGSVNVNAAISRPGSLGFMADKSSLSRIWDTSSSFRFLLSSRLADASVFFHICSFLSIIGCFPVTSESLCRLVSCFCHVLHPSNLSGPKPSAVDVGLVHYFLAFWFPAAPEVSEVCLCAPTEPILSGQSLA